jgi:hypothetical protein
MIVVEDGRHRGDEGREEGGAGAINNYTRENATKVRKNM